MCFFIPLFPEVLACSRLFVNDGPVNDQVPQNDEKACGGSMKISIILRAFLVISFLISTVPAMAQTDGDAEIHLQGRALSKGNGDYLTQDEVGLFDLIISKKGDKYFWTSNKGQQLIKVDKELIDKNKVFGSDRNRYTIFLNPEGEGQIIIRHSQAQGCTDITPTNYKEYRLNNTGGLKSFSGITDPYPYPDGGGCSEW